MSDDSTLQLNMLRLPVSDMEAMLTFYRTLLNAELLAADAFGTVCYIGRLRDIPVIFCPKEALSKDEQNKRHNFRFTVERVEQAHALALQGGGTSLGDIQKTEAGQLVVVHDPDGNTVELLEEHA